TLTLLDVSGKVVRTQTLNGISTSINTASLNSGVYFVTINDGTSVSTQKVVIKK
ncbi:MAG: T9SS C-terminal target domain-containing protein, partial [Crocinitomicaceae bacterium]|nr:T9SS C-terminal target domain-containing protein [Crocinitomicaceae bacterium]